MVQNVRYSCLSQRKVRNLFISQADTFLASTFSRLQIVLEYLICKSDSILDSTETLVPSLGYVQHRRNLSYLQIFQKYPNRFSLELLKLYLIQDNYFRHFNSAIFKWNRNSFVYPNNSFSHFFSSPSCTTPISLPSTSTTPSAPTATFSSTTRHSSATLSFLTLASWSPDNTSSTSKFILSKGLTGDFESLLIPREVRRRWPWRLPASIMLVLLLRDSVETITDNLPMILDLQTTQLVRKTNESDKLPSEEARRKMSYF